ncbi:hypothetical protein GNF76_07550 [Pseudomonas sp. CCM 7893]|uniref:DUF8038 domain-containing protein n=1 Tax=Pseudomonas spelaei TaxID=1055469 RepID=A0A6I3W3V3_9PSED|nr:hypothetical protein [Pseudomonas spelaei]MUF04188.1 hypothetical protein [Pseudomonas spelaei]
MITSNSVIQTPRQMPLNGASAQVPTEPPPLTRYKRDTAISSEPDENTRAGGDSALAVLYGKALLQTTGVPSQDSQLMLENIPPSSTFGQWWAQLGRAMQSPDVAEWMRYVSADPRSVKIAPESGHISYKVQHHISSNPKVQSVGQDDKRWSAVNGPVMEAAKVIAAGYGFSTFQPPLSESSSSAPLWLVKRFYREKEQLSVPAAQQRAAELERDKAFPELPMAHFSGLHEVRSEDALDRQKAVLGNHNTRRNAASEFKHLATLLESGDLVEPLIRDHLEKSKFQVEPYSTYSKDNRNTWGEISLKQFLDDNGLDIPTHRQEVENLTAALLNPEPKSPPYGNYGGALAWPTPLDSTSLQQLKANLKHGKFGELDLKPFKNVLEYLMQGTAFEPSELHNPPRVFDRLIQSPKGQALGKAIQAKFETMSVKGSVNDWLLAALSVDQSDQVNTVGASSKFSVAGFPLTAPSNDGKTASAIFKGLVDGLVSTGKSSSPEKAALQVNLLLSTRAPEFLVEGIPDKVTPGSHSWVSFVTAVGRLEAKAPGSTATMTYADVMLQAAIAPISAKERHIEYAAQQDALKDWGAANGLPYPQTDAQMDTVRNAFNAQISELKTASETLNTPMPNTRDMALEQLRKALPDMDPELFDEKHITLQPPVRDLPGPYSILDLYRDGRSASGAPTASHDAFYSAFFTNGEKPYPSRFTSSTRAINIPEMLKAIKELPDISSIFKKCFSEYAHAMEKSIATQAKHLISQQPIHIRKNFEEGKITIVREDAIDYAVYSMAPTDIRRADNNLLIKTERNGSIHTYEIDLKQSRIIERMDLGDFQPGTLPLNHTHPNKRLVEVKSSTPDQYTPGLTDEKLGAPYIPDSFNSERTSYIADALVKNTNIRELQSEAMGLTTFDTEVPFYKKFNEFMLNLIPLRSAIVNFQQGNIGEGILDLSLDVLGFVVGVGAAAKGAKVLSAGASAFSKLVQGAKIVGRAAIGSLNPVDGFVDLAKSVFTLGKKGVNAATHKFKALIHSADYDLLSASKRFDASSIGTFKFNNELLEGPVVLTNGKWHTYNPITGEAYGPALKDFLPSARINTEDFGKWATADGPVKKVDEAVVNTWKKTVNTHRNGPEKNAFENGYHSGNPQTIRGFSRNMKAADVMKLAGNKGLTAEQIGMLVKKYDDIAYEFGRVGSARFIDNIEPRFGEVIPMPQVVYFSQTAQLSDGQCAALSRAMATAMAEGKEQILIKNMFTAAAFPTDPASRDFIAKLSKIQTQVGGQSAFHAGQPIRQLSIQDMVKELADATVSKSIMIDSPGHAMAAGVKIDGTSKTYYFYDPNHGLANFSSAEAMEKGLERLSRDKKLTPQYKTHSTDSNKLEFKVFDHDDTWQKKNSVFGSDVKKLYDAPITPSRTPHLSNAELKRSWETLQKAPGNQDLICYEASIRVGQAEKNLLPEVFDAVKASTNRRGGTNYSQNYLDIMGIKPDSLKTTFNPADITESGLLNFKHANEGGAFGHTVYIQKTNNNELFLFNTNSPDLDVAMIRNGNPPQISGAMTVYNLSDGKHKGLQDFLGGFNGKEGWQFAYTPASTLNANVQNLKP